MSLTKSDSEDPIEIGESLIYTLTVTNNGPSDANAVELTDTLPEGVRFDSSDPPCSLVDLVVTCGFATVPSGDSEVVQITVDVSAEAIGTITNNAEVIAQEPDPDSDNNSTSEETDVVAPPPPHAFVLLADKKVTVEKEINSVGAIHSNDDIDFKRGNPSTHTGNLTAVDNIDIEEDQTINGDVSAGGTVTVHSSSTVNGTITSGAQVDAVSLPQLSYSAGGSDVTVNSGQTLPLDPGSYGDVKVKGGGTLALSRGDYFFVELIVENDGAVSADVMWGPVTVNVVEKAEFGDDSSLTVTPVFAEGSRLVTINHLDQSDKKRLTLKKRVSLQGNLISPNNKIEINEDTVFKGVVCAEEIKLHKDVAFVPHD